MKILIAMDSFKGSLTAPQACAAVRRGMAAVLDAEYLTVPMADGGEGTAACMAACGGTLQTEPVPDLFGRQTEAQYALLDGGNTSVVETAVTAGIADLKPEERDVLRASTYGVGMQIRNALARGCRKLIVGFGGSASNDGGMGALQALGVRFYDRSGALIPDGAGGVDLERVVRADCSDAVSAAGCEVIFACDVTNPYFGENGAAYVFAPQKGADGATVARLDAGLRNLNRVLSVAFGKDCSLIPGSGAAGGLCGGLLYLLPARIQSGFDVVASAAGLEQILPTCDLVVTGEGKTDGQTAFGKLPCRLGETAKRYGVPVVCLSGSVLPSARDLYAHGIAALFDATSCPQSLSDALENAEPSLTFAAENLARLIASL